jgi:hypothetical protein
MCQQPQLPGVREGWDALNGKRYEQALTVSKECIDQFGEQARDDERALVEAHEPEPSEAHVDKDSPKAQKIFHQGVLNDTAACYVIAGKSLEATSQTGEARKTYEALIVLKHALIWDPQGWFWSPAKFATRRLAALGNH